MEMSNDPRPAARLKKAREDAGYDSARQAAIKNKWVEPTYAAHENATRRLTINAARRYARAFRVTPEWLLFGSNEDADVDMDALPVFTACERPELEAWINRGVLKPTQKRLPVEPHGRQFGIEITDKEMLKKPPELGERSFDVGDTVIADPQAKLSVGDFVVCFIGREVKVRKYRGLDQRSGRVLTGLLNSDYPEQNEPDCKPVGRVFMHIQAL